MSDEALAYRRLYLLIAVVAVALLLVGGIGWKSIAYPTPIAPALVQVSGTTWSVTGCVATNMTGPGFVVAESSVVTVNGTVENLDPNASCAISAVSVGPGGFTLVGDSLPTVLSPYGAPGDSATVQVSLRAPSGWVRAPLALVLLGAQGA